MDEKELEQLQLQVDKLTNEYEKLNTLTDETYKNKILNYTSELESIYNDVQEQIQKIKDENITLNENIQNTNKLLKQSQNIIDEINNKDKLVNGHYQNIEEKKQQIDKLQSEFINNINTKQQDIKKYIDDFNNTIDELNNAIDESQKQKDNITSQLEISTELLNEANTLSTKIKPLHQESVTLKNEISDLYDEIYGYEYKDKQGQLQKEEGLQKKLEITYDKLENQAKLLSTKIDDIINDTNNSIKNYLDGQSDKYKSLYADIQNLLPSALTAGLASAYSEKRESEEKILAKSNKSFSITICFLSLCSFIPIIIGYIIFKDGKTMYEIIGYMPKLVSLIIPLYIPLLWAAINFNKQAKLSKRLIEEYTHKEVISKTFEGLSKQVEQIDSDNVRELNLKLLYNIINMTSDNPGQLIKGFDQSDHPLIEVLNNIMKSEKSLDNLSNIPGIALIIEQLQKRLNKIKSKNKETIEDNIES